MPIGYAVIGANYGDEGKGLITDYFSSIEPEDSIVVRFNGGAQAGHTVVTPDGRRHVFSHFGAGSFTGCPTYLSQFFIVNPILFAKEREALRDIGVLPKVIIDSKAVYTTPYDMLITRLIESRRGSVRHGSCGLGINETITRCRREPSYRTQVHEFLNLSVLQDKLMYLGATWLPSRLKEYGIEYDAEDVQQFLTNEEQIVARFINDVEALLHNATVASSAPLCRRVIFEGAQGLMLDEDRIEQWPHVTRSKTGLFNVLHLMPKFQLQSLDVTYVTRTYLTRHGAGPLPQESDWSLPDSTNVPNPHQGHLRFAPLNWSTVRQSVATDLAQARLRQPNINFHLAVTCADQRSFSGPTDLPVQYLSYGPCRSDISSHVGAVRTSILVK